ncbi:Strictosidine synthase [Quillaja saponaria]|uniref:Strictosidine synthase n=1 Tax=Quillaja saponaria TaxID=32244 RepID=A0AAD7PCF0_QUISA|nr:Strictosidine synthase [Quillaja saponaria]
MLFIFLFMARPNRRLATQLATSVEGVPFLLANGLDIDLLTTIVYFTDYSSASTFHSFFVKSSYDFFFSMIVK